jgi:hypothetical protein
LVTGYICTELKAGAAAFKVRRTLILTLIRNPATTYDEESNRQSVNTGLRWTPTTLALALVGYGWACTPSQITEGICGRSVNWQCGARTTILPSMSARQRI